MHTNHRPVRKSSPRPKYQPRLKVARAPLFRTVRITLRVKRTFQAMRRRNNMRPRTRNVAQIIRLRNRLWPPRGLDGRMMSGGA